MDFPLAGQLGNYTDPKVQEDKTLLQASHPDHKPRHFIYLHRALQCKQKLPGH